MDDFPSIFKYGQIIKKIKFSKTTKSPRRNCLALWSQGFQKKLLYAVHKISRQTDGKHPHLALLGLFIPAFPEIPELFAAQNE